MFRSILAALLLTATPALAQNCPHSAAGGATPAVPLQASSTGTTGAVSASLPAAANKYTYVCGFAITSAGATTASVRSSTIVGTGTTLTFAYLDPVSAAGQGALITAFPVCIPSSGPNTAITLAVPGTGTGTVALTATLWGCQQ